MRYKYMTGIDDDQLGELVRRVWEIFESRGGKNPSLGGRPPKLDLFDRVAVTLALLRQNMTQQLIAGFYGVSQPTVSLIKSELEPVVEEALMLTGIGLEEAVQGRPVVVDGTSAPTGNRRQTGKENHSGKRHCQNPAVQVASDLDGVLLDVSDPVPGRRHDAAAIGLNGRDRALEGADQIADTANTSAGAPTPTRKKPGPDLPECHREPDKQLSGLRCAVERRSAHLKNWKILTTGYRRQPKRLPDVIRLAVKHEKHRLGR